MLADLKTARKTLKPFILSAGYNFAGTAKDWLKDAVATAEVRPYGKGDGRFIISCGVDYRLPQEERNKILNAYGRRLVKILKQSGFEIDLEAFGGFQTFVVSEK